MMNKKLITYRYIEIEQRKFHGYKNPIVIDHVDVDKILISKKVSFGKNFKYFLSYKDNYKVKLLYITLPEMNGCTISFDETKCMSFSHIM